MTKKSHHIGILLALVLAASFAFRSAATAAPIIHATASFVQSPPNAGYDLRGDQMAGARFSVTQPTEITAIGGQLYATGTLFGAIVTLGADDLPMPNPAPPSAIAGILAMTTFSSGSTQHTDFRTPLSVALSPGTYGLVIGGVGSGLAGRMALTGNPLPGAEIFANSGGMWRDLNVNPFNRMRFVIEGRAVPELSTALLIPPALIALSFRTRRHAPSHKPAAQSRDCLRYISPHRNPTD